MAALMPLAGDMFGLMPRQAQAQAVDLHESRTHRDIAVSVALTALAFATVILRLLARKFKNVSLAADDWMILVAMLFGFGTMANEILCCHWGLGKHQLAVTMPEFIQMRKVSFSFQLIYSTTLLLTKFSILLMYRRIFEIPAVIRALYLTGVFIFMWWIAVMLVAFFQCSPISAAWEIEDFSKIKCIDRVGFYIGAAVPNIATDLALLIFPLPVVWSIQIPRMQKILLSMIFLLGGFATAASIIRLKEFIIMHRIPLTKMDYTWSLAPPLMWSCLEVEAGIASACLPTLRPIYQLLFSSLDPSRYSSNRKSGSNLGSSYNAGSHSTPNSKKWIHLRPDKESSLTSTAERNEHPDVYGDQYPLRPINNQEGTVASNPSLQSHPTDPNRIYYTKAIDRNIEARTDEV
ncbi:MAG: hypothetical protein M1819_001025 [Sarea resinae]|nr:MAG: hypothetical protein M1819_001025 [Sarea resinae]